MMRERDRKKGERIHLRFARNAFTWRTVLGEDGYNEMLDRHGTRIGVTIFTDS